MTDSDEYSKLDPKYAKIISLTKKVTALERSVSADLANVTSCGGSSGGYRGSQGDKIVGLEKCRTVNNGATIQHKGKRVWWCLNNKHKYRLFYGLYVWHKPEDQDAWFEKFKSRRSKKDKNTAATTSGTPERSKQVSLDKLTISQCIKGFLCSNLMLSDADVDK